MVNKVVMIVTPSGSLACVRPLAVQLLKEGVISGDIDGVLHAADAATVKAAMAASGVCDFCGTPGPQAVYEVPDFDMPEGAGQSTGGWAACAECDTLIKAAKRDALLKRAQEHLSFPKWSSKAVKELQQRFWQGLDEMTFATGLATAAADYIEDRLPPQFGPSVITARDRRLDATRRASGLTVEEMAYVLSGQPLTSEVATKLLKWQRRFGARDPHRLVQLSTQPTTGLPPSKAPHWQQAIDAKFQAAMLLRRALATLGAEPEVFPKGTNLKDGDELTQMIDMAARRKEFKHLGYQTDIQLLLRAQAYSFNAETTAAILEGSKSLPHDAPLSSIDTPSGGGWFWFGAPLPYAATPMASDFTHALLWGWTQGPSMYRLTVTEALYQKMTPEGQAKLIRLSGSNRGLLPGDEISAMDVEELAIELKAIGITQAEFDRMSVRKVSEPMMAFSAYVLDEKRRDTLSPLGHPVTPSARWFWPAHMTFNEMLAFIREKHRESYGPGGDYAGDPNIVGADHTVHIVSELTLFFLMACVWFRQTVPGQPKKKVDAKLTREDGHLERHAKKRYQREFNLEAPPTVQVVALRRTERVLVEDAPGERQATARKYECRWIVAGHARMQRYGPGRKDQKLIWIDAHPAGPADKPLKTKGDKVYAVIR